MAGTATLISTRPFSLQLIIPQDQHFWHLPTPPQPHPALEFHSLEHAENGWVCCPESCSTARHLPKLAKPRTKQGVGFQAGGGSGEQEITESLRHSVQSKSCQLPPPLQDGPSQAPGWHFTGQKWLLTHSLLPGTSRHPWPHLPPAQGEGLGSCVEVSVRSNPTTDKLSAKIEQPRSTVRQESRWCRGINKPARGQTVGLGKWVLTFSLYLSDVEPFPIDLWLWVSTNNTLINQFYWGVRI